MVALFFFLVIDDTVPLDCILNGCYLLCTNLSLGLVLKINSTSSNRTNMQIHICIFHNLKVCVRSGLTVSGCHRRGALARDNAWEWSVFM